MAGKSTILVLSLLALAACGVGCSSVAERYYAARAERVAAEVSQHEAAMHRLVGEMRADNRELAEILARLRAHRTEEKR